MLVYGKCECFVMQMLYVTIFHIKIVFSSGDMTEIVFSWPLWQPFWIYANKGFA